MKIKSRRLRIVALFVVVWMGCGGALTGPAQAGGLSSQVDLHLGGGGGSSSQVDLQFELQSGQEGGSSGSNLQFDLRAYRPGEILVRLHEQPGKQALSQALQEALGASRLREVYGGVVEVWGAPQGRELEIVQTLQSDPRVAFAEPNYLYRAFVEPNDPSLNKQRWVLEQIQAFGAWDLSTGSDTVTIAVLDTGIDETHPELSAKLLPGYDFIENDSDPHDLNGHGTHVAGVAAASADNKTGIAGLSWGARLLPVRVLDEQGYGAADQLASGILWAAQHGAQVINISLGGESYSSAVQSAIHTAHAGGSLVVAAAGNCRVAGGSCPTANPLVYPAAMVNVLAVSATNKYDEYTPYSQYGAYIDLAAPGGDMQWYHDADGVYSTMPTYQVYLTTNYGYSKSYDFLKGTSQAAPHVAGLAALAWSLAPGMTPDQVQGILQDSAADLGPAGWDPDYGWGRIDALAALLATQPPLSTPALAPVDNADGDGAYTLAWSAVDDATGYRLEESALADFSAATLRYSGAQLSFAVSSQAPGVWFYRVRAENGAQVSEWSAARMVGVTPAAPVLDPIDNPAQVDAYTLAWSAAAGAAGYLLQESGTLSFTLPVTRYLGTALSYNLTGQPGGEWHYRVLAFNAAGYGPASALQATTVLTSSLAAPELEPVLNTELDGAYALNWTEVVSATSYLVEQSGDAYFSAPGVVYSGALTTLPVTKQPPGDWYYRVRALAGEERSPWSDSRAVRVEARVMLPLVAR